VVEAPNQPTKQQSDPWQEKEESKTVPLRQIKPLNRKKESTKWFEVGESSGSDSSGPKQALKVESVEMRQIGKISLPMQFTKNLSEAMRLSKVKEELDLFDKNDAEYNPGFSSSSDDSGLQELGNVGKGKRKLKAMLTNKMDTALRSKL